VFVAVVAMAVTMTMGMPNMRMSVIVGMGGIRGRSRGAIMRVIPVGVVVGMRVHSRYRPFYARFARLAKRGSLLSGYLDTSGLRFR
jgi:hypothetical protein